MALTMNDPLDKLSNFIIELNDLSERVHLNLTKTESIIISTFTIVFLGVALDIQKTIYEKIDNEQPSI